MLTNIKSATTELGGGLVDLWGVPVCVPGINPWLSCCIQYCITSISLVVLVRLCKELLVSSDAYACTRYTYID